MGSNQFLQMYAIAVEIMAFKLTCGVRHMLRDELYNPTNGDPRQPQETMPFMYEAVVY